MHYITLLKPKSQVFRNIFLIFHKNTALTFSFRKLLGGHFPLIHIFSNKIGFLDKRVGSIKGNNFFGFS